MNLDEMEKRAREAKGRAEKATAGPWALDDEANCAGSDDCGGISAPGEDGHRIDIVVTDSGVYPPCRADALFIAASRFDLPVLADDVLALAARVRELERIVADPEIARMFANSE